MNNILQVVSRFGQEMIIFPLTFPINTYYISTYVIYMELTSHLNMRLFYNLFLVEQINFSELKCFYV